MIHDICIHSAKFASLIACITIEMEVRRLKGAKQGLLADIQRGSLHFMVYFYLLCARTEHAHLVFHIKGRR